MVHIALGVVQGDGANCTWSGAKNGANCTWSGAKKGANCTLDGAKGAVNCTLDGAKKCGANEVQFTHLFALGWCKSAHEVQIARVFAPMI